MAQDAIRGYIESLHQGSLADSLRQDAGEKRDPRAGVRAGMRRRLPAPKPKDVFEC